MILPTRGAPVDTNRRAELPAALNPQEVVERIDRLIDRGQVRLTDIFSDDDVHQLCDELEIEFRERDFTPAITLGLFVSQCLSRGDACSTVVTKFNRERKRQGKLPCSEDASAYCKARAKLPVELIDRLGKRIANLLRNKADSQWKWNGLNVYLVDGLVFRAPDTQANQERYPQPSSQKEGLGFPQIRCVVTTCLATGCIVNYNTAAMKGKLNRRGVELVCGIKGCRHSPFEGVCEVIDEKVITLEKPKNSKNRFTPEQWQQLPESIEYRCIRYRLTGRKEVLTIVTTLIDSKRFSAEEIAELYGLRWDVETDIACWKTTMGFCDLRCHTPENLDREIAVGVLAYNLVRSLMNDAAAVLEIHPREVSFSRSRDAWMSFSDELETSNDLMWIVLSATSRLVRDRPGREEPRAIKKRNQTKYPKLKSPRPSRAKRIAAKPVKQPEIP